MTQSPKNSKSYYPPYSREQWPPSLNVFDLIQTPLWIYDHTRWRQYYINRAGLSLWGCSSVEMFLKKDFRDNSEATERYLNSIATEFLLQRNNDNKGGIMPKRSEKRLPWTFYPDGVPTYCYCAYSPYWLDDGRLFLIVEATPSAPPIAETSRAVEALRHVSTRVTVYDSKGYILYQNPSGMAHLVLPDGSRVAPYSTNATAKQSSRLTMSSFLPHWISRDDVRLLLDTLAAGKETNMKVRVRTAGGERHHLVHAVSVLDPAAACAGDRVLVIAEEDITKQVYEQEELVRQRVTSQLLDDFLKITSHELKTPLHGISGIAEQLSSELSSTYKASLSKILSLTNDLNSIVTNILEFAELTCSSDCSVIEMTTVSLPHLTASLMAEITVRRNKRSFSGTLALIKQQQNSKELVIETAVPEIFVVTHEPSIRKTLRILIGNAIKFTPTSGKITINASLRSNNRAIISVTDTGVGIAPEFLARLFTPFLQEQAPSTRQFGGSGLSLALAKKYVGLCKGEIWASSAGVGQGSSFSISLPVASDSQGDSIPGRRQPSVQHNPQTAPEPVRILSVDDDPLNQMVVKSIVANSPWQLQQAMSGPQALRLLRDSEVLPNLILLDIMMPDMSGHEVAALIREKYSSSLPVIALSATPAPKSLEGLHFTSWVQKPFKRAELLRVIQMHLPHGERREPL